MMMVMQGHGMKRLLGSNRMLRFQFQAVVAHQVGVGGLKKKLLLTLIWGRSSPFSAS
jgi:hypothetical protein